MEHLGVFWHGKTGQAWDMLINGYMKQQEATAKRPFYSVCYQYERNPWTLYSCNRYGAEDGRTMSGTDNFELAKATADRCLKEPGITYAQVSKTTDCYNHETVYKVGTYTYGK